METESFLTSAVSSQNEKQEVEDLPVRWPFFERFFTLAVMRTIILAMSIWLIYAGVGMLTQSSWPLAIPPPSTSMMSYQQWVQSQQQAGTVFQWVLGPFVIAAGLFFGRRGFVWISRRILNRHAEEGEQQNGNDKPEN